MNTWQQQVHSMYNISLLKQYERNWKMLQVFLRNKEGFQSHLFECKVMTLKVTNSCPSYIPGQSARYYAANNIGLIGVECTLFLSRTTFQPTSSTRGHVPCKVSASWGRCTCWATHFTGDPCTVK